MDAHSRVWKALSHEEPDRVPTFCQHIEAPFVERYDETIEIKDDYGMIYPELAIAKEMGLDSKWHHSGSTKIDERNKPELPPELKKKYEGMRISNEGHVYERNKRGETWYQDGILKIPEVIKDWISFIKTWETADDIHWKHIQGIWDNGLKQDMVSIPTTGGPTYITWAAIGLNRLALILRKNSNLFVELLSAITDITIKQHNCLFEKGIDMVFICDDHSFKDRCMFNDKQFKELLIPNFKRMADNAHKHGAKFLVHSDGCYHLEAPYLVLAGVDAMEPLEHEANNDLKMLKEKYGDKISLIGNVAASSTLTFGSVEDTIKHTKQCLLDAADGGGYILAPGSDVLGTIKIENLQAMIDTVKKYGHYPIDKSKLI